MTGRQRSPDGGSGAPLTHRGWQAQQLPGVTSLGAVTDGLGRHRTGVGLVQDGVRQELIFDPATSTALETALVAVGPKQDWNNYQPAGTVLSYIVYVTAGLVNSGTATLPATPPARR